MTPLPHHLKDSIRVNWHITSWCNYSCGYCPVVIFHKRSRSGARQPHAFDHYPVEQWLDLFRQLPQSHIHLKITGGEPFLDRKNLRGLLAGLTPLDNFHIGIDTNGFWDPAYYKGIDTNKVFVNVSCHPKETDFEGFLARLVAIRDASFRVAMVNFILAPENLAMFEKTFSRIESEGFFVNVSTMDPSGTYLSRTARDDRELRLIERYNTPVDVKYKVLKPATKGRPCFYPALSYYMMYDGRIQVSCTGSFQNAFTDGMPDLPREAVACPFDRCVGCADMYRAIEDEELVTSPLKIFTLEDYACEVGSYRKEQRWKNRVRDLPGGLGRLFGAEPTEQAVGPLHSPEEEQAELKFNAAGPPRLQLPPDPLFGAVDGSMSIEARSRDRITLSGWAASVKPETPVEEVRLLLGDQRIGTVRHFYYRPAIAAAYGRADLVKCGWRTMAYLPPLAEGEYKLIPRVIAVDGSSSPLATVHVKITG